MSTPEPTRNARAGSSSASAGNPYAALKLTPSLVLHEREVSEMTGPLDTDRLLTLFGYGGVGKTRLASPVGHGLTEQSKEVAFVDLSSIDRADLVSRPFWPHSTSEPPLTRVRWI